jgi:hypothetical protein
VKRTSHHLYLWAASLILMQMAVAGQSGAGLAIQVVEASAGQNLIADELPPIKVRVMDRTGRVISGANVLFAAPEEGPTGHFVPNASQITVTTDTEGMAAAPRFRTNSTEGDYQIQIVASYGAAVSRVVIPQSNVLKKKSSKKKMVFLSAILGGAAAAVLASRGGDAGPASSALGALATPTVTVGGESPVGVSPTTTSFTAVSPGGSSSVSAASSPTVIAPIVDDVCARMPPNSNRRDCRP